MKIATWNVNSIKARLGAVTDWLREVEPDVLMLQETKTVDEAFPHFEFESLGYRCHVHGQKSYNGVAIISREPVEDISIGLPGDGEDDHARYMEGTVRGVRLVCIYLPNGNPVPGEKFDYKLRWMDRLITRARELLDSEQPFLFGGDFNICPEEVDVYDPVGFANDALCRPESRARFRTLINLGLTDALRVFVPAGPAYTYWDYTGNAWLRDHGLRIDHFLLSPQAADRMVACEVDRGPRGRERASDHTPVWCRLDTDR